MDIRTDAPCACGHTTSQHELRAGGLLGCYIVGCLCADFTPEPAVWHLGRWEGATAAVEARGLVPLSVADARALAAHIDADETYGPYGAYRGDRLGWVPPTPDAIAQQVDLSPEGTTLTSTGADLVVDFTHGWIAGRDLLWPSVLLALALHRLGSTDAAHRLDAAITCALDNLRRYSEARR